MRTHRTECRAATKAAADFVDLTDNVQAALEASGIRDGQVTVFNPNPGCVLIVNERESGLLQDIATTLERLQITGSEKPAVDAMRAHPIADQRRKGVSGGALMIGSSSVVLPAVAGRLRLGMWQRLFLLELERAADRPVVVQIVGE